MKQLIERLEEASGVSRYLAANIYTAVVDILKGMPNSNIDRGQEAQMLAYLNTGGRQGEMPFTQSTVDDTLKLVLLKPPSWLGGLPENPRDRLRMFKFLAVK